MSDAVRFAVRFAVRLILRFAVSYLMSCITSRALDQGTRIHGHATKQEPRCVLDQEHDGGRRVVGHVCARLVVHINRPELGLVFRLGLDLSRDLARDCGEQRQHSVENIAHQCRRAASRRCGQGWNLDERNEFQKSFGHHFQQARWECAAQKRPLQKRTAHSRLAKRRHLHFVFVFGLFLCVFGLFPCRNHKGHAPMRPGPYYGYLSPSGAGPKQALSLFVLYFKQRIATSCLILCTK
jgi:hypothetical protein